MYIKGVCLALFGIGVFLLVQVALPFVTYKTWEIFALDSNQMLADPRVGSVNYGKVLGVSVETVHDVPTFIAKLDTNRIKPYAQFKLSVPSIKLEDVTVNVDSNDFDEVLAQLPGTAFPGEKGNLFISGHSSIPNVKIGKEKAWFVDLPKVKKGDDIYINALGQNFHYVIEGMKVVDPTDISVIAPPDNEGRYLTLMTCVPPGFNTKRLVVLARLQ